MRLIFACEQQTDVRLVRGLSEICKSLEVVTPSLPEPFAWRQHTPANCKVVNLSPSRLLFPIRLARYLRSRRADVDVVLVQGSLAGALGANMARRLGGPKVILLVCSPTVQYYDCRPRRGLAGGVRWFFTRLLLKAVVSLNAFLADRLVVLSNHLRDVTGSPDKTEIIPVYGVNTNLYHPLTGADKLKIRTELGLPTDRFIVFYSSRVAPEKDAEGVLKGLAECVARGHTDMMLLHLSGGCRDFARLAAEFGLGDYVDARPAVDPVLDLAAYYQASDVCVQASRAEGLGFSPLEAMACGIPTIVSKVGGLVEVADEGKVALFVLPGAGWAKSLLDVKEGRHPQEIREAARSHVEHGYEHRNVFTKLGKVINQCTSGHCASPS